MIFDAHCDSPSQMYRLRDFGLDNPIPAQVDFPKMIKGGMSASFFALYIFPHLSPEDSSKYADDLLDVLDKQMVSNSEIVSYAYSANDIRRNLASGKLSILVGMENGSPLQNDFSYLEHFYKRGVRYVTLTHSRDNQICDSCSGEGRWGGLSPFGKEMVEALNEKSVLIDLAHSSDATVRQVLDISQKPVSFTHGCCRALASHRRNLPDDLIKKLADKGGVMGISIYPCFVSDEFNRILDASHLEDRLYLEEEFKANPSNPSKLAAWNALQMEYRQLPRPTISDVAAHIDHAVNVGGIEHVGIGTDYDGIEVACSGLEDISSIYKLFDELKRRGYNDDAVEKISGLNLLHLLDNQ